MVIVYFLICLALITFGALTKNENYIPLFLLPMGIIALLFQKFIHKEKIKNLGFRKCKLSEMGKGFVFPVIIIFLVFFICYIFGFIKIKPLSQVVIKEGKIGISLWSLILIIAFNAFITFIIAFITEELAFRGYMISRLRRFGYLKPLIFSSLLFGIWHLPPAIILLDYGILRSAIYVFNISLLGILFGSLFLESKSLIPPSIFHGVWNALDYGLFGLGEAQGIFTGDSKMIFDPEEGIISSAVLILFSIIILWRIRTKNKT